eukprot:gene28604-31773_t
MHPPIRTEVTKALKLMTPVIRCMRTKVKKALKLMMVMGTPMGVSAAATATTFIAIRINP